MSTTLKAALAVASTLIGFGLMAGQGFKVNGWVLLFWVPALIVMIVGWLHRSEGNEQEVSSLFNGAIPDNALPVPVVDKAEPLLFKAKLTKTEQRHDGMPCIYLRVRVTNESSLIAEKCQLKISLVSPSIRGLSIDTPLPVKDEWPNRVTDITAGDSKQFDFSVTWTGANSIAGTYICSPNFGDAVVRRDSRLVYVQLFGPKITEVWRWKFEAKFEDGTVEVSDVTRIIIKAGKAT